MKIKGIKILLICLILIASIYADTTVTASTNSGAGNNTSSLSENSTLITILSSFKYSYNASNNVENTNRTLIPEIQALLDNNNTCFTPYTYMLYSLSFAEQQLFVGAYLDAKINNSTTNNSNRCFSPTFYKNNFLNVATGSVRINAQQLTTYSVTSRNSLNCLKNTFDTVASSGNTAYNSSISSAIDAIGASNQCASQFLLALSNTLALRRRFLLTTTQIQANNSYLSTYGEISYPYTNAEMYRIVDNYIYYGKCINILTESYIETFSESANLLAADSNCKQSSRLLSDVTVTSDSSVNVSTDVISSQNTFTDANSSNKDTTHRNLADIFTTITNAATNLYNTIFGTANALSDNVLKGTIGVSANVTNLANVQFDASLSAYANDIAGKLNATSNPSYLATAQAILQVNSISVAFKSRTDMINMFESQIWGKIYEIMAENEKINSTCTGTYQYVLTNINTTNSVNYYYYNGSSTSDIQFNQTTYTWQNTPFKQLYAAAGCINGTRFLVSYTIDPIRGNYYQFAGNGFNTAVKAGAAQAFCYQTAYKNLFDASAIAAGYVNASSTNAINGFSFPCMPAMKSNCYNKLTTSCQNSMLFNIMSHTGANPTGSAINVNCKNASLENASDADYLQCLKFVDSNFISYTLFPITQSFMLGSAFNVRNSIVSRRYLAGSSAKSTSTEPTASDPDSQFSSNQTKASSTDATVDGSNNSTQTSTPAAVSQSYASGASSNFIKTGLTTLIAFSLTLIF